MIWAGVAARPTPRRSRLGAPIRGVAPARLGRGGAVARRPRLKGRAELFTIPQPSAATVSVSIAAGPRARDPDRARSPGRRAGRAVVIITRSLKERAEMKTLTRIVPRALALALAFAAASALAAAQTALRLPRPSPKASATQTIGVTDVTITYSRPGVKGRKIWGDPPAGAAAGTATLDDSRARPADAVIVPYGRVWRTGANEATTFKVTDDVLVNGQPLPAGVYSLHTIPGRDEWTIIFNKDDGQWGSFQYDEKKDALRVKAKPQMMSESQEWLSFAIDPLSDKSAQVSLRWEKVSVPFTVEIKDVNALAFQKAREAVAAAKPDDWQTPLQAAAFAVQNKLDLEQAMLWADQALKARENFNTLNVKARVLAAQGKTAEAIAAGEKALMVGKAATPAVNPQALANFEKLVGEWKSKK
jgi:hypothetical protein